MWTPCKRLWPESKNLWLLHNALSAIDDSNMLNFLVFKRHKVLDGPAKDHHRGVECRRASGSNFFSWWTSWLIFFFLGNLLSQFFFPGDLLNQFFCDFHHAPQMINGRPLNQKNENKNQHVTMYMNSDNLIGVHCLQQPLFQCCFPLYSVHRTECHATTKWHCVSLSSTINVYFLNLLKYLELYSPCASPFWRGWE